MDSADATSRYIDSFVEPEDEVLTAARTLSSEQGVGPVSHVAGTWLRWCAGLRPAHDVVEIGGGLGYSALWLLAGMHPRGMLTTIEVDPDRQAHAQRLLGQAGHGQRVRNILGAALTVLPRLADDAYDLVFIDGPRTEYPAYLSHARRLLRPGGVLIADGILAGGKVADASATDDETAAVRTCAATVRDDPTLCAQIVPVGDGLLIATVTAPDGQRDTR